MKQLSLKVEKENEQSQSLVLPAYSGTNKAPFLCDLIAFIFFIKGQCPSFKEVEEEVKLLMPSTERTNKQEKQRIAKTGSTRPLGLCFTRPTKVTVTPAKTPMSTQCQATSSAAVPMFTCYASPVDCKFQTKKIPKLLETTSSAMFTCYTSPIQCQVKALATKFKAPLLTFSNKQPMDEFVHGSDELHVSFINETFDSFSVNISIGLSQTLDSLQPSTTNTCAMTCIPKSPILHIKRNVHQERMLRCLAEVVPGVLLAAPHCNAIMLAFGPSLLSLDQAVLLEFAEQPDEQNLQEDDDDKDDYEEFEEDRDDFDDEDNFGSLPATVSSAAAKRQRQLVFSQLLGVSGLADAIPLTSMHVLLSLPRSELDGGGGPPPPPFRPRPQFRLRPACRLIRLTLPCRRQRSGAVGRSAVGTEDSVWFHSATPVPGYALPDIN